MKLSICLLLLDVQAFAQCNNILTNGNASAGITGWNFSTGAGSAWVSQNSTYGAAFVASYNWTTMNQTVDLYSLGYTSQYLNLEPAIFYSQMLKGHEVNYSDKYYYKIELRNASNQLITSYSYGSQSSPITVTSSWDTVSGTFTNYGSGLRYIKVECGGDDAEYWAGNYGTIIDNSVVSIAELLHVNICSGTYTFNNQTISSSGIYTGNFTGAYGCDSTVILDLHIGPYNIEDTLDFCIGDTYMFNGTTYTSDTNVFGNFTSYAGCDSNVSHSLRFHDLFDDTIHAGICPGSPYLFGSQTIYTPGFYSGSFTSAYGCDSNVVLDLSYNPTQFNSVTHYLCPGDTYDFGGNLISSNGNYFGTFVNSFGCDSLINLTVIMDVIHNQQINYEMCGGDTAYFGSQILTESGLYTETFPTSRGGCDSTVTMNIVVIWINTEVEYTISGLQALDTASSSTFQWLNCNLNYAPISGANSSHYFANSGGSFAVEITNQFCIDTSDCYHYTPAGISEFDNSHITVYPNPAGDHFTVTLKDNIKMSRLSIIDAQGRVLYNLNEETEQSFLFETAGFANGMYHLLIETTQGSFYHNLAVLHE